MDRLERNKQTVTPMPRLAPVIKKRLRCIVYYHGSMHS